MHHELGPLPARRTVAAPKVAGEAAKVKMRTRHQLGGPGGGDAYADATLQGRSYATRIFLRILWTRQPRSDVALPRRPAHSIVGPRASTPSSATALPTKKPGDHRKRDTRSKAELQRGSDVTRPFALPASLLPGAQSLERPPSLFPGAPGGAQPMGCVRAGPGRPLRTKTRRGKRQETGLADTGS